MIVARTWGNGSPASSHAPALLLLLVEQAYQITVVWLEHLSAIKSPSQCKGKRRRIGLDRRVPGLKALLNARDNRATTVFAVANRTFKGLVISERAFWTIDKLMRKSHPKLLTIATTISVHDKS